MAEGMLERHEVTSIVFDRRVDRVTVETAGGEIWFTTDGRIPRIGWPAGTYRTSKARGPVEVPASEHDPTIVKMIAEEPTPYVLHPEPSTSSFSLPVFDQVVFRASDGSIHRITIDADGALVTEPVGGP